MELAVIVVILVLLIILIYGNPNLIIGALVSVLVSVILTPNIGSIKYDKVGGRGQVEFPYKKYFISRDRIPVMLNAIKTLKYIKAPHNLQPAPQKLELVRQKDAYDGADVIGDLFTEEARMIANVDHHPSPLKFWQTREMLVRLEAKKKFPDKYDENDINPTGKNAFALRETIYAITKEANQFSPSAASAIYKLVYQYLGHKIDIFDPFAGWGDRGIAAIASLDTTVNSYTGIDANSNLRKGYELIGQLQQKQEQQLKSEKEKEKVKFHIADSLTYLKDHIEQLKGKFDLVFTSPPYYNYETYSQDNEQSIKGKSSYQDWLKTFYEPILVLLATLVKPNGIFIIHVGPTYSAPTFDTDTKVILDKTNLKFYNTIYFNGGRSIPAFIYTNFSINKQESQKSRMRHDGCRLFC